MIKTDSPRGRVGLMVAHCAGMLDTVALPVWVGTLVASYRFEPQQAGLLVALFLAGVVAASVLLAPRFNRLSGRTVATTCFLACALGFGAASMTTDFVMLALVHVLCGAANGAALSVTHGTIALSANPHRLFAIVNMALVQKAAGHGADARDLLQRAVSVEPRNAGAHYNLAVVADEAGDAAAAIEHYRMFLKLGAVAHADLVAPVRARLAALGG